MKNLLFVAFVSFALAGAPNADAYFIREANGTLTTDVPGVTIAPTGPEVWTITVPFGSSPGLYSTVSVPGAFDEPSSEPGLVNIVTIGAVTPPTLQIIWTSDVVPASPGDPSEPNPTTTFWSLFGAQSDISVTFEDLGDAPSAHGVPDAGSSLAMLGFAVAGCVRLKKRFAR